jgi:serpin B
MLFDGPTSEGNPISHASTSDGVAGAGQVCPIRARFVGGLYLALGAGVCTLAIACLTASVRSPAATGVGARDAQIPTSISRPAPIPTPIPETERRILDALAKPFPAASHPEKMKFQEAIARIAKFLPMPVDLDSNAFADANFDPAVEVVLPAGQRTVGDVLDFVLSDQHPPLDWTVVNGSVTITTIDKACESTDMRAYDVTDLVEPVVTPDGTESWDSKELIEAIQISFPSLADGGEEHLSILNVNGRVILVARARRVAHQDLVRALVKIREMASAGSQSTPSQHRRRVVQAAKPDARHSRVAYEANVAALQALMSPASDATVKSADASCNAFAFDLYRQLGTRTPGNTAVCPFGVYAALALLKEGAAGEVEQQIGRVLHAKESTADLRELLQGLSNRLEAIDLVPDYELSIENRVWCDDKMPIPQALGAALRERYHVETHSVPFLSRPDDAAFLINNWVKNATDGRIDSIIAAAEITAGRIDLAITNAVLFRGLWAKPFNRNRTVMAPFHAAGRTFDVAMMRGDHAAFPLGELDGVQILELPYRSGLMSALILLPHDSPGALNRLEASLSAETLKHCRQALRNKLVKVELPRFEIESDFRVEESLKALGMPRAFVPTADFSKLGRSDWGLAYVRQKTLLKVNEEGTEAMAAAGMLGGGAAKEHLFRADRPFLFLIQEKSTGLILFVARVTDPNRGI